MSDGIVEMSRAIRLTIEKYAANLHDLPDEELEEFAQIVGAYAADLDGELEKRKRGAS